MILDFIDREKNRSTVVAKLKARSEYFPEIIEEIIGEEVFYSTIARVKINTIWYKVHCLESVIGNNNENIKDCLFRLINSVYLTQNLFNMPEFAEKDTNQEDEVERLTKHCLA